ncbi:MAG: hypothetical protein RL030_2759 [Pseudomonadota bacterium]|jgi:hypothetical protein
MKFYEYDAQGWMVGWHEDASRPNSTQIAPAVPPNRARWDGSMWVEDARRELAQAAEELDRTTKHEQTIAVLRAFDPTTATAADVHQAVAALIRLVAHDINSEP